MTFVEGYPDNVLEYAPDFPEAVFDLRRMPHNPHDRNAVAVVVDRVRLGYIPKELAAIIAPEMDHGEIWEVALASVLVAPGHESNPGVALSLVRLSNP
jgi:hypothetical protein